MENGDMTEAASEKNRLEVKQRAVRKMRQERGFVPVPFYFEKVTDGSNFTYVFNGKYWKDREEKNWSHLPDLFSDQLPDN